MRKIREGIPSKPKEFPVKFICHTKHYDNVRLVREGMDKVVKEAEFDTAVGMGLDKKGIPMSPLLCFYYIDGEEDIDIPIVTKEDADEAFAKHVLDNGPGDNGYEPPKDEPEDEDIGPSVEPPQSEEKKRGWPKGKKRG